MILCVMLENVSDNCELSFSPFSVTDSDGRSTNYLNCDMNLSYGQYKLTYNVMGYYKWHSRLTFYPYIDVSFSEIQIFVYPLTK